MMKSRVYLAGALLAAAGAANAGVSVTPTVVSDYDFRGVSQTAEDPALQLSVNLATESGVYAGIWGSNVDFGPGDPNVEVDVFAGWAGGDAKEAYGWDLGAIYYTYVSASDFNYPEVYAGLSKGMFAGKLSYSWDWGGDSRAPGISGSAFYAEGSVTYPLPQDFALVGHAGYSFGGYWSDVDAEYFDWSVGVTKSFGNFAVALKYIDGSDLPDGNPPNHVFSTDGKLWASVSTTLPWAR